MNDPRDSKWNIADRLQHLRDDAWALPTAMIKRIGSSLDIVGAVLRPGLGTRM
jgi:hypothetical protein